MKQFEYKIIDGTTDLQYEGYTMKTIENRLNKLGEMGWEICGLTLTRCNMHSNEIYLKREISKKDAQDSSNR